MIDYKKLEQDYGTPLYIYDLKKIKYQVETFKAAFPKTKMRIKYAMKALSNISILQYMRQLGVEIDAVSLQETQIAQQAGYTAKEILFTPNCVGFHEIEAAAENGFSINIDDLNNLESFGKKYHGNKACCIRINPHIMAGGNEKISTGHIDSKFGISIHQLNQILKIVKKYQMKINGIHVHTGSDILDSDVFLMTAKIVFNVARNFGQLEFLDFGSGFKVPYRDGDIVTDLTDLGQKLEEAFLEFCQEYGKELELWFEPGKYLVSESGTLLTKVQSVKTTPTNKFVGVDSGLHHLIRPMMYDSYHHIENVSHPDGNESLYTVVGQICETDTIGKMRTINEVRHGDLLAIRNAGAYGMSMASNYNSRLRPAEVAVNSDQVYLIRKREVLDDLLKNQPQPEIKLTT